jgi:DNA-directed RNA polymerase subunit beta
MNVGQVLECHLGFAAKKLGEQVSALAEQTKEVELKKRLRRSLLQG